MITIWKSRTHEVWELFNVDPFRDVESATPLLPGRLADNGDGVLGRPSQPVQRTSLWRSRSTIRTEAVGGAESGVGAMGDRIGWHLRVDGG